VRACKKLCSFCRLMHICLVDISGLYHDKTDFHYKTMYIVLVNQTTHVCVK